VCSRRGLNSIPKLMTLNPCTGVGGIFILPYGRVIIIDVCVMYKNWTFVPLTLGHIGTYWVYDFYNFADLANKVSGRTVYKPAPCLYGLLFYLFCFLISDGEARSIYVLNSFHRSKSRPFSSSQIKLLTARKLRVDCIEVGKTEIDS